MKNLFIFTFAILIAAGCSRQQYRTISLEEYIDKMKAGWVGQMAGVGWGAPTEFKWNGKIIPEENVQSGNRKWLINSIRMTSMWK